MEVFEKYYDEKFKEYFYYNPITRISTWVLPQNANIIDKSKSQKKEANKKDDVNKDQEQYKKLSNLYPEYFKEAAKENAIVAKNEPVYQEDQAYKEECEAWRKFSKAKIQELMKKPARIQLKEIPKPTAYHEGTYDYNVWYDKFLTDRHVEIIKTPALYKCDPDLDSGYTKADWEHKNGGGLFCVYFCRGCCTEGPECRFYHRVPQPEDLEFEENSKDVFGRIRHATPRSDNGGIGMFTTDCRTLVVSDLQMPDDSATPIRDMVKILYNEFSKWGEIEDINFISQ